MKLSILDLQKISHQNAVRSGLWNDRNLKTNPYIVPAIIALIHSEITEALEGFRKNLMDDKLPNRLMIEVELADALIRIGDLAEVLGLDLTGAIIEKWNFNKNREDHKLENRAKDGGKKF